MNVKDLLMGSTALGSKQGMPLIQEPAMAQRPLIKGLFMCYQSPQGSGFILHCHCSPVHSVNMKTVGANAV